MDLPTCNMCKACDIPAKSLHCRLISRLSVMYVCASASSPRSVAACPKYSSAKARSRILLNAWQAVEQKLLATPIIAEQDFTTRQVVRSHVPLVPAKHG